MLKSLDSFLIIGFLVIIFVAVVMYLPTIRKLISLILNVL